MRISRTRALLSALAVVFLAGLAAQPAHASFVGYYALENFTLLNVNSDGSAMTPDGGLSLVLTGPDDGSGQEGTTTLVILAAAAGTVSFDYSLFTEDAPEVDSAGWVRGSLPFPIYTVFPDSAGSVSFAVAAGQPFGFRVWSEDNSYGELVATITNFQAPVADAAVPEPGFFGLTAACLAGLLFVRRRLRPRRVPASQVRSQPLA
jgi:hypothetical protein